MATEAKKLQVGGFVLVAVVLAAGMLVWVGATRWFSETVPVATYVEESVQGLEEGSPVKYRGVPIGVVDRIDIAPDPRLVEIVMEIEREHAPLVLDDPTLRARLELVGITGTRFLEIEHVEGSLLDEHPTLGFTPPCPVIPSVPSLIETLTASLDDVFDTIMAVDLQGLSQDLRGALQDADALFTDARVDATLTHLERATRATGDLAEDLRRASGDGHLTAALLHLEEAAAGARDLLADLGDGSPGRELRTTLAGARALVERGDGLLGDLQRQVRQFAENGHAVMGEAALTLERLDVAVGDVEAATRGVRDQPSLLLFADQPAATRPGRGGRR